MITGDELAFVRLAMRKRILTANLVREAVERKKWDSPDQSIPSILVSMGALDPGDAARLKKNLRSSQRSEKPTRPHATVVGRDRLARETPDEVIDDNPKTPKRLGKYEVKKLLGAGAMGAVYHALDTELRRDVALKLLMKEGAAPSPRAVQRFKREARLAARLDHPNIVRVFEAGEDGGYHYIAMEMVQGRSVSELIALGEMTPRRAVHIIRKVAEATGYAHDQDVIHRDLKPANILVDGKTGEARVTDYGLAVLSEGGEDDRLTRTGAAVGTPAYMAPEQVRGQLKKIDGRTDIYAVGATLYEMLTGHPPFEAPTFLELAKKICDEIPASPRKKNSNVPTDVSTICLKALEKDKEARYQHASEMAADLSAFLADQVIQAKAPGPIKRLKRWARRRPALVTGIAGFMGVVLFGVAYYLSLPGTLELASQPPGVKVIVDGETYETPAKGFLKIELSAGEHEIRFDHPDYLQRAPSAERAVIRHGLSTTITASLVSRSGVLKVDSKPRGAEVTVLRGSEAVKEGTTPFMELFEAGAYTVRLRKAGYLAVAEREVKISSGGVLAEFPTVELQPDPAGVHVKADRSNVILSREGDATRYVAPDKLSGAGKQTIVASKAGYLSRRIELDVASSLELERRVSLPPLAAYRVPLEGRLVGNPLARDIDGDGAQDLVVLEDTPGGIRLAVLPGAGHASSTLRVATSARVLVDAIDVNRDGILDLLLGDDVHVEIRDGSTGEAIDSLPLSANTVSVSATEDGPPELLYVGTRGLQRVRLDRRTDRRLQPPAAGVRVAPLLLTVGDPSLPTALAVWPGVEGRQGGGLYAQELTGGARRFYPLTGVDGTSPVAALRSGLGRSEQTLAVALSAQGPAYVVDPAMSTSNYAYTYKIGDDTSRFSQVGAVLPKGGRAWLLLTDARADRTRLYAVGRKALTEQDLPVPRGAVVLRDEDEPLLWTPSGRTLRLRGKEWKVDPLLSTDAATWTAQGFTPVVADLDGDGFTEALGPSQDRRSLVALAPDNDWLRWRAPVRAAGPTAIVPPSRGEKPVLLVASGSEVRVLRSSDGLELARVPAPGPIRHLAASAPSPSAQHAALHLAGSREGQADYVARFDWNGRAWEQTYAVARQTSGLAPLGMDLDKDGKDEVVSGAPLAALLSSGGQESWTDKDNTSAETLKFAAPQVSLLRGKPTTCIAPSKREQGGRFPKLVGLDPEGGELWKKPAKMAWANGTLPDPPLRILVADGLPLAVVLTKNDVVALQVTDGVEVWRLALPFWKGTPTDITGAALFGGVDPTLVLTRARHEVVVFDARSGNQRWKRRLPPGPRPPSNPVVLPRDALAQETLALIAPSGDVVFYALSDGAYLAERRGVDGPFEPWLETLRVADPDPGQVGTPGADTLVVSSGDGHLLALGVDRLPRRLRSRRQAIREQLRRIELGEPFVSRAVTDLNVLAGQKNDTPAQLALAEALLTQGRHADALSTAQRVIAAEGKLPRAMSLVIKATFAKKRLYDDVVRDQLVELADDNARLAAQVAFELSSQAAEPRATGSFLRLATTLAPVDNSIAHRRLGSYRIAYLTSQFPAALGETWDRLPPQRLQTLLGIIEDVRADYAMSLANQENATARAAALVVTVLEYHLVRRFFPPDPRKKRLRAVRAQLTGLMSTDQLEVDIPPLLRTVRRVVKGVLAKRGQTRGDMLRDLGELAREQPEWSGVVDAVSELGK